MVNEHSEQLDAVFHAADRQLVVSQRGGALHSYDPATGLWSTTRPFGPNDLVQPDIRLLASAGEDAGALWGVTAGGGLVRRLNGRWEVVVGDTKFLGRRGTPIQQDELSAVAASADGNTVVGSYGAYPTFSMGVAEGGPAKAGTPDQLRTDGFIWQPHVGMTPVWSLLERNDLPLPDVHSLEALAVSANGQTVLLQGVPPETTPSVVPGVSLWLLRLTPRPEAAP